MMGVRRERCQGWALPTSDERTYRKPWENVFLFMKTSRGGWKPKNLITLNIVTLDSYMQTLGLLDFLTTQRRICSIWPPLVTPGVPWSKSPNDRSRWPDRDFPKPALLQFPTTPPLQVRDLGVGLRFCMQLELALTSMSTGIR